MSDTRKKEKYWAPPQTILKKIRSKEPIPALILFDIDGTLVITPKVHNRAFIEAFKEVFGLDIKINWFSYSGRTDSWIISDIAIKNGISIDQINRKLEAIMQSMSKWYAANVNLENGQILPGVREFLQHCDEKGYLRGLVTGNLERIAFEKLKAYNLHSGFAVGGFGNEHMIREQLIKIAIQRSVQECHFKQNSDFSNVFYIADTPLDVIAARAAQVNTIIAYNGMNQKMDWKNAEPLLFVNSLKESDKIFEFIESSLK